MVPGGTAANVRTAAFVEFKKEEIEQSVSDRFEQQVRRCPDRVAVKTRSQELTYAAVNQAAPDPRRGDTGWDLGGDPDAG